MKFNLFFHAEATLVGVKKVEGTSSAIAPQSQISQPHAPFSQESHLQWQLHPHLLQFFVSVMQLNFQVNGLVD